MLFITTAENIKLVISWGVFLNVYGAHAGHCKLTIQECYKLDYGRNDRMQRYKSYVPVITVPFTFSPQHLNNRYGCHVPLVLMNSFNTHDETMKTLRKYKACNLAIHCFNQSCHPRIVKESLLPLPTVLGNKNEFNVEK